jgi:hypothetical protein
MPRNPSDVRLVVNPDCRPLKWWGMLLGMPIIVIIKVVPRRVEPLHSIAERHGIESPDSKVVSIV